ncbi:MAG: HU family DNA-binding protein [Pseudomonadota bacterium]
MSTQKSAPKTAKTPVKRSAVKAKKTSTAKPKAPVSPAPKAPPAAQTATPAVVNGPEPIVVGPELRKKELIDTVVQRSGMKKRDVKPIVETMLAVFGEGLAEGREVIAPPMGKLRVHKKKTTAKKRILFAKLHQNLPPVTLGMDPSNKPD